jgi:hypothetical protein
VVQSRVKRVIQMSVTCVIMSRVSCNISNNYFVFDDQITARQNPHYNLQEKKIISLDTTFVLIFMCMIVLL